MPSHLTITLHGWTLWLAAGGAAWAAVTLLATLVTVLARLAAEMRAALDFSPPGPLAAVADEPEVLTARAWGDSMDGLREDALRRGRGWFGPDARLKVLEISDVTSSLIRDPVPGSTYRATVLVRCLDGEPEPSMESAS